jgi:hypothetical protein
LAGPEQKQVHIPNGEPWSQERPEIELVKFVGRQKRGNKAAVPWDGVRELNPEWIPVIADLKHASKKTTTESIMMCSKIGSIPSFKPADQNGAGPKDFMKALTRSDWRNCTKAETRFKEYLTGGVPKRDQTPMSPNEFIQVTEVTDEDVKEAEKSCILNYWCYTVIGSIYQVRNALRDINTVKEFRGRLETQHFKATIKAREYRHITRDGILYTKPVDKDLENILVAHADSRVSVPRNQGGRCVMMNGAVISFASKRHTTIDDSTTAAGLTELFMWSCNVEDLRHLMEEVGLCQQNSITIYQDNIWAIQIAMNKGQLAKKTRAMSLRLGPSPYETRSKMPKWFPSLLERMA